MHIALGLSLLCGKIHILATFLGDCSNCYEFCTFIQIYNTHFLIVDKHTIIQFCIIGSFVKHTLQIVRGAWSCTQMGAGSAHFSQLPFCAAPWPYLCLHKLETCSRVSLTRSGNPDDLMPEVPKSFLWLSVPRTQKQYVWQFDLQVDPSMKSLPSISSF